MKVTRNVRGNIIYLMKVTSRNGRKYHLPDEG